ncbi:MAG: phosphotransferase, partial [Planctomycetota bacterium]
ERAAPSPLPPEAELAIALSHYELGVIDRIHRVPLGDPGSVKHVVRCAHGLFLLKRRRETRAELERVRFTQRVHAHCTDAGFPAPALVGSSRSGKPLVAVGERLYELVRWAPGERYAGTPAQTQGAGAALALCHRAMQTMTDFPSAARQPGAHASPTVVGQLAQIESDAPGAASAAAELTTIYSLATLRADEAGLPGWPQQVVHADWHPGNLHFDGHAVSAVVDFDTARVGPRALDIAGGALQFSLTKHGQDPSKWPEELDRDRYIHFVRGYESQLTDPLSSAEVNALPWLMMESLVCEASGPVAASGGVAGIDGAGFHSMIEPKARGIRDHADDLVRSLG